MKSTKTHHQNIKDEDNFSVDAFHCILVASSTSKQR